MTSRGSSSDIVLLGRLLAFARPYWGHIFALLIVSLLAAPIALLTPVPVMILGDLLVGQRDPVPDLLDSLLPSAVTSSEAGLVLLMVALLVATALLRQLQELGVTLLQTYTGEKLLLSFRAQLFGRVQRLSLSYHDVRGTADSTYRIHYDATAIQSIAVTGVIPLISAALTLAGMVYVTAAINARLAVIALAVSPPLALLTWVYRRRLRERYREVKRLESTAMSVVQEVLTALRVVKAFGQEKREEERFVHHSTAGMRARIRASLIDGGFALLIGLLVAGGMGAVLYVGVHDVRAGILSPGALLLVMGYVTQLYEPLKTMSRKAATLQSAFASAERAFSLLDENPDVAERAHARPIARATGKIAFYDVSFTYDGDRFALENVSFVVPAATQVGIAGATGAGKTTLVSLLTRFYDPTSGRIELDGVDLREYKLADLREQFAIVLQDTVLFSTSIAENIAYARPAAHFEEIVAAAKAANAHEFILRMPDGYDTQVGERGMRLSGGERQRISLARAFLKDAPILILDEPTSSVDTMTEALILNAMEQLMQGRTTFMIAHRLSTLENCDMRLQIETGRLVGVDSARGARVIRGVDPVLSVR